MLTVRRADKHWETFTFLKQNSNTKLISAVFQRQGHRAEFQFLLSLVRAWLLGDRANIRSLDFLSRGPGEWGVSPSSQQRATAWWLSDRSPFSEVLPWAPRIQQSL